MSFKKIAAAIAAASTLASTGIALAGPATLADFGPAAITEPFESLGQVMRAPSLTFDQSVATSDDTISVAPFTSCTGLCLGNTTGNGFINILLATPVSKAGAKTGMDGSNGLWSVSVDFFDQSDALLGTVTTSGVGFGGFFGWMDDTNLIKRIRINDTGAASFILLVDDLITETPNPVPLPAPLWSLGAAIATLGFSRRKRA